MIADSSFPSLAAAEKAWTLIFNQAMFSCKDHDLHGLYTAALFDVAR